MIGERTSEGLEIRLRPRGIGRGLQAAFLGFWLCGWVFGEGFALWMLISGAVSFLTGRPFGGMHDPVTPKAAGLGGAFLLFWLGFWTVGGWAAWNAFFLAVWAEERLIVSAAGLTIVSTRGPFRSRREIPRDEIRRVALFGRRERFVVETAGASAEIATLGTPSERREAAGLVREELGLDDGAAMAPRLPDDWEVIFTPEGERALVPNLATRRARARWLGALALAGGAGTYLLGRSALEGRSPWVPFGIVCVLTIAFAGGAVWHARGRTEWRLGSGRLTRRRRFGGNVTDGFEAGRLRLGTRSDEDHDEWFRLEALPAAAPPAESLASTPGARRAPLAPQVIAERMNDGAAIRSLGEWIARETGLDLEDGTTKEARQAALAALLDQMQKSGPLGRIAGRVFDKVEERNRRLGS